MENNAHSSLNYASQGITKKQNVCSSSSNADLYVFNHQMVQGYRGVNININTRDNDESLGDMHMKDHMDVSNQENVAPVYFQSLM